LSISCDTPGNGDYTLKFFPAFNGVDWWSWTGDYLIDGPFQLSIDEATAECVDPSGNVSVCDQFAVDIQICAVPGANQSGVCGSASNCTEIPVTW
jgi:hypothetical protein